MKCFEVKDVRIPVRTVSSENLRKMRRNVGLESINGDFSTARTRRFRLSRFVPEIALHRFWILLRQNFCLRANRIIPRPISV